MSDVANVTDWEQSKENIRPMKSGRDGVALGKKFGATCAAWQDSVKAQQAAFEDSVHNEQLDALDTWIKYAKWSQLNEGVAGSALSDVLERGLKVLREKHFSSCKDDIRFLKLYLLYAEQCQKPGDIFAFVDANDIGSGHAQLYEAWSQWLEAKGNFQQAEEMILRGLRKNAAPIDSLRRLYASFQARKGERAAQQREEGGLSGPAAAAPLSMAAAVAVGQATLSASGTRTADNRSRVNGVPRASFSILEDIPVPPAAALPSLTAGPSSRSATGSFAILSDEAATPVATSWATLPAERVAEKENTLTPTTWNNVTMPQLRAPPPGSMLAPVVPAPVQPQRAATRPGMPPPSSRSFEIFSEEAPAKPATAKKQPPAPAKKTGRGI
jgi:checkpoint serine/threonine-protein kinase